MDGNTNAFLIWKSIDRVPLGLIPCLIIHRRPLHVVEIRVHFDNSIIKVSYSHIIALDNFVFKVTNVFVEHGSMPNPQELAHLKPDICFILLAVLISSLADIQLGFFWNVFFIFVKEPFKKDILVLDESIPLILRRDKCIGKLSSSLFEDIDQLVLGATGGYL
jgi:hypothetical protein